MASPAWSMARNAILQAYVVKARSPLLPRKNSSSMYPCREVYFESEVFRNLESAVYGWTGSILQCGSSMATCPFKCLLRAPCSNSSLRSLVHIGGMGLLSTFPSPN